MVSTEVQFRYVDPLALRLVEKPVGKGHEQKQDDIFYFILIFRQTWQRSLKSLQRHVGAKSELIYPVIEKTIKPRRKSNNKPLVIKTPMFYEYVAANLSPDIDWKNLFSCYGVAGVLAIDEVPLRTTRKNLKGMLADLSQLMSDEWEGQSVEIISGPFKGQLGIFTDGRVSMRIFGRTVAAKMSVFNIRKAK